MNTVDYDNLKSTLKRRLQEPSPLIQVILGPRQVGKTTAVKALLSELSLPNHYTSADNTLGISGKI